MQTIGSECKMVPDGSIVHGRDRDDLIFNHASLHVLYWPWYPLYPTWCFALRTQAVCSQSQIEVCRDFSY